MLTRVLLLRHAKTSAPDQFHGAESDVALGAEGRHQAFEVAARLRTQGISAVYSSAMLRATETAKPISDATGVAMRVVPELHERRMGPLSGTLWTETRPIYEETMARWMLGDLDATHPGGESYREMRERILPAFRGLVEAHRNETIAIVAHGVVNRVLMTSVIPALGVADLRNISIEHVEVHQLIENAGEWNWSQPPTSRFGAL